MRRRLWPSIFLVGFSGQRRRRCKDSGAWESLGFSFLAIFGLCGWWWVRWQILLPSMHETVLGGVGSGMDAGGSPSFRVAALRRRRSRTQGIMSSEFFPASITSSSSDVVDELVELGPMWTTVLENAAVQPLLMGCFRYLSRVETQRDCDVPRRASDPRF